MDTEFSKLLKTLASTSERGIKFLRTLEANLPVYIKPEFVTTFYSSYCRYLLANTGEVGLAEAIPAHSAIPLVVTGILKFSPRVVVEHEELEFMALKIIHCYQQLMINNLSMTTEGMEILAVHLDHLYGDFNTGFEYHYRIQFPYCRLDPEYQRTTLRSQAVAKLTDNGFFLEKSPVNGWDTIINADPVNSLLMYGSSSRSGLAPLEFRNAYTLINDPDNPVIYDPNLMIHPNYHSLLRSGIDLPTLVAGTSNYLIWLPILLSIYYGQGQTMVRNAPVHLVEESPMRTKPGDLPDNDYLGLALQLIDLVDKKRALNRFYLKDIGRALFYASRGKHEGLKAWLDFARRGGCSEDVIQQCQEVYYGLIPGNITHKTIAFYARADNPDLYNKWHLEWCQNAMDEATGAGHAHVAKALYRTYWLDYTCSAVNMNSWYQFVDHHWVHIDKAYTINIALSEDFMLKFDQHRLLLNQKKVESGRDMNLRNNLEATITKITALFKKLADDTFGNKVLSKACHRFYDPRFVDRMDNVPHAICVQSGVIEMDDQARSDQASDYIFFRPGKPEDYITMSTGVPYDPKLRWDSPAVVRNLNYIQQLMVEPELITVFKRSLGSFLFGGNLDKKLFIWTGPPNAGKSTITREICMSLGQYAIKGDKGILGGGKQGDAPSPSLARSRGTRSMFYEELDERRVISASDVKGWTGNDEFFARMLHSNGGQINPLFKMVFVCNIVPQFSSFDAGIKERVYIIPFTSKWVENAPLDPEQQMLTRTFKVDRYFNRHLPEMARGLLWLMVQWYPEYAMHGLPVPRQVVNVNEKYWKDHDYYVTFMEQNFVSYVLPDGTRDPKFSVILEEAFEAFRAWFKSAYQMKVPSMPIFKSNMEERMGPLVSGRWYGIAAGGLRRMG